MSFSLGQAKLILDADAEPLLTTTAKSYSDIQRITALLTKYLADQTNVRVKDVKAAASIILAEEKKLNQDLLNEAKKVADDRKKTTQELIKVNQQQYKQEQADIKAAAVARKQADEQAKRDARERTQVILRYNKQQYEEEQKAAKAAEQLRRRQQRESQQSGVGRFVRGLPGDLATIAGFGAIASGAIIVREALVKLTEATLNQQQAQRSLNAAFGDTQVLYKQNADELAKQFSRVSSEVEQATTRFAVLQKQTVLTGEQIRALNKVAIDNQAAFGGDLIEAHRALAGAILGETEAYEKYGVVLQEGVLKSSEKLTEDEKRRFTTMSESEKQMIRYRIIMEEAGKITGAAAERAKDAQGGFDALNRSTDELAKTIGGAFVKGTGEGARALAGLINVVDDFFKGVDERKKAVEELQKEQGVNFLQSFLPGWMVGVGAGAVNERIQRNRDVDKQRQEQDALVAQEKERIESVRKARQAAEDKDQAELKVAREKIEASLKYAHDQEIKRINERIKTAEIEKKNKLDALEDSQRAELRSLEDVENARKRASELELARIQNERDKKLQAAEDKKDAELERINAEKDAAEAAAEEQIRRLEIEKEHRQRINEETKANELKRIEEQKEEVARQRVTEDRQIEDAIKDRERALEDEHRKTLRRLEREGEAARARYDKEIRQIDDKESKQEANQEKENRRHDTRMRQIEDEAKEQIKQVDSEADARIKAIEEELRAFESAERARDNARRRRELGQQLSDAQLNLRRATGTQDPIARAAAQQKLVGAIRVGDPDAIKRAQQELVDIVGQGQEAIASAQRELSNIQEDLRDEDVKQTEEAQKEKLEAEKRRIEEERDLEKERIQTALENEKRAEDERDRRRTDRTNKDKRATEEAKRQAKDKLDDALKKIETQQEAEDDHNRDEKRRIEDLTEFNKRKIEDRRKTEDQAFEDAKEASQERYRQEQKDIEDTYDSEETGAIPAVRRAMKETKDSYDRQTVDVNKRYKAEQDAIHETYDNEETGLIARHRRMEQDAAITYQHVADTVRDRYRDARTAVEKAYRADDGKSGILDQLDTQKEYTDQKLKDILDSFDQHAKGLVAPGGIIQVQWEAATGQAKKYFEYIDEQLNKKRTQRAIDMVPGGIGPPDPGIASGAIQPSGGNSAAPAMEDKPQGSTQLRDPNTGYSPFVLGANAGSYWTDQGTHKVEGGRDNKGAADIFAPIGTPIYAAVGGTIRSFSDRSGGNAAILSGENGYYYYLAHGNVPFTSGRVTQGQQIGEVGDTGSARGTSPHLHFSIATDPSVFDRLQGKGNIRGDASYWRTRDLGYRFNNPTAYMDLRTGEQGVLAELGPERLLGRQDTQAFESMGLTGRMGRPSIAQMDYYATGVNGASAMTAYESTRVSGDVLNYYGVAPESLIREWRSDQRRRNHLHGLGRLR